MSGQRSALLDYARYVGQMLSGFRARHEQQMASWRERDVALSLDLAQPQRALDLANGRLRPQYSLLRGAGQRVIGIDLVNHPAADLTDRMYRVARWFFRRWLPPTMPAQSDDTLICGNVDTLPLRHVPRGIEAWDHLRQRRLPVHVPLNEWRIQQYVDEFARHFEIVKQYCAMREGEELLTPDIERELAAYTRDKLTCGATCASGRVND